MKKVMNNTRRALIAFMAIFTMASAQSFTVNNDGAPAEFKYIGTTNNQPVFQLNMNNTDAAEFVITLKALSGELLYSEKVAGRQIERKYRLSSEEFDAPGITVEVKNIKDNSKIIYTVNRTIRTVEDVVINKL